MYRYRGLSVLLLAIVLASNGWCDPINVLMVISDDQSYPHASIYGDTTARTPNFDAVARSGVLFRNAFCASPGCSPSRAALLTGMPTWQLREAGTHASGFPAELVTYPERLQKNGYAIGYTGKGWGPGKFQLAGRKDNPAGPNLRPPKRKDGSVHYAAAFQSFLESRADDQPFCFWFGSHDPHRSYAKASGLNSGRQLDEAVVPGFLPDCEEIRSDLLDYAYEIERFDRDLGEFLQLLKKYGLEKNTLVIVTSDNGMPFPRAKANCYEAGIHVPLAIQLPGTIPPARSVDDLVGFVDLTATIYEATGIEPADSIKLAGRSLWTDLQTDRAGVLDTNRDAVFAGRERHSSVRYNSLGYPQRCIRTSDYLYIRNFRAERWPAGAPQKYGEGGYARADDVLAQRLGPMHGGYHDIDACPTLTYLIKNRDQAGTKTFLEWSVSHRPTEELFDIRNDPACLNNLASDPKLLKTHRMLSERLNAYLKQTGDPRVSADDGGDVWETYPRYSRLRWFPEPDWLQNNTRKLPDLPWLEKRRPKPQVKAAGTP